MKKIFYSFAILSLVFTACNPMEDIYEEVDAQETIISGEAKFTLTDGDYDDLGLNYGNFSSTDDAKDMLPEFLSDKFPAWGKESLAEVTFKLYQPAYDERSLEVYTVTSQDYADGGHTYGNFSRESHIIDFLNTKYPAPANRLLVSLTYKYYSGSVSTLNNGFLFVNGEWQMATGFTAEEYATMGEGYSNFSSEDEALAKIPVFLLEKFRFSGKMAGDVEPIMYKLYVSGSVLSYIANFIYDGATWSVYNNVVNETIKFGHDGMNWVPDNTIKYTLTTADYVLVGNGNYGNFDVRAGKDEESVEARLAKINTILLNNFPSDAEGQKYLVSYNIYNGAAGVWTMAVIKSGSAYILQ
ncbi:MAG: hypothetical protein P8P28_07910 [Polaribacter sp.]|jgi:hypothetical protein|nr:hypothetical protein [Polaribacter sp.]